MPKFSVIVPTHNVQAFVRQCLDSLLAQTFDDFEVVVVDDASTDDTRRIIDEFAASDDRVTVLRVDDQLDGPGLLRNRALDHSTGDWIVCVDSDDWVEPDLLSSLAMTIDRDDPDLVLYDYERTYWWGKRARNAAGRIIQERADQVVRAADHPELFELMPVAWNKAVRRSFLDRTGIRFPRGIYEDQPWSYGLLAWADRISIVDAVHYHYRQRRQGNLLRTESVAHFDILEQWDLAMDIVRSSPSGAQLERVVFDRMVDHALFVYGRGSGRLPRNERHRFFDRMSETYRRHLPDDYDEHPKISPVKTWLVENDSFGGYEILKRANLAKRWTQARLRRRKRATRRWVNRTKRRVLLYSYRNIMCRLPIHQNRAVFAAYWNRQYACNPRAIYEAAREHTPEISGVWSVAPKSAAAFPDDVETVLTGTWRWYYTMATAKYFINNVNFPDEVVKRPGQVHLQTQHGTPLKRMGIHMMEFPVTAGNQSFRGLLRRSDRWDYCLSSNHYSTEIWPSAYPCGFEMLNFGYPRNDVLARPDSGATERLREEYDIAPDKGIILYAPTLRDYEKGFRFPFEVERLSEAIGNDHVLLVRVHYLRGSNAAVRAATEAGFLVDVSDHPSVEELYLASDLLITDYSSVMFDYANLGRPIVIYAHDWPTYLRTRGTYFDLLAEPPGAVATDQETLEKILVERQYEAPRHQAELEAFRARFCEFDDGHAGERVAHFLFRDEPVAPCGAADTRGPEHE